MSTSPPARKTPRGVKRTAPATVPATAGDAAAGPAPALRPLRKRIGESAGNLQARGQAFLRRHSGSKT